MLTDTHVHFDDFVKTALLEPVLQRAREAGVGAMVAIGGNPASNDLAAALAARHPDRIRAVVGFDRDQHDRPAAEWGLDSWLDRPGVVGVGEIGLDYYYGADSAAAQKTLFAGMLEAAARRRRPVVVHSRYADRDTLDLLGQFVKDWRGGVPGVLHCFTGDKDFAAQVLDVGFMISFSGIVTFRNADDLRKVVAYVPDDRLLVETDSPYLAPAPHRGKPNEPAFVADVARRVAELRGVDVRTLAALTTENAHRLFALHGKDESK